MSAEVTADPPDAENQGKGAAVMRRAAGSGGGGLQHALQVDADGQHQIEDCPRLLAAARADPDCLISGQPLYDDVNPKIAPVWPLYHPFLGLG